MGLKLYKQKRHFDKTPEPAGKEINHKGKLAFVIQKHDASHLHYDFRLEADGVLKSWAIPKGPSYDPSTKRLAMMVEDHPYDYRTFEGVIPSGNYGAGNVIVWDAGTYESSVDPKNSEKEILKELKDGNIKIRMFGKKMKGLWALVRMKSDEKNSWLLLKEKDEYANPDEDITVKDKSIVSRKTIDEVGGKTTKIDFGKLTRGFKKEKVPDFIEPMLATLIDEPFDKENWYFEIKWDGYRAIADVRNEKIKLYSRNNILFNDHYPKIVDSLKQLKLNAVFDGEIVVLNNEGKPDFQLLQNYRSTHNGFLAYYIFDILYFENINLMALPLEARKKILEQVLETNETLRIGEHIKEHGINFYNAANKIGLEGIIAKKADSAYKSGVRGENWLKIKTHMRQEVVICGFTQPRGGRKYFGALILGIYKEGELVYVGHTGSGFDDESLREIDTKLRKIVIDKSPFKKVPKTNEPATWIKPKLVCEVEFSEWTTGANMRHPVFKGLREDKEAKEVTIETAKKESVVLKKAEKETQKDGVKISNPDKIFFPKEGYTKEDLIEYYKDVSPFILPYLKDRVESLKRYPNGVEGESFFQKNFEYKPPEFVKIFKYQSESEERDINYLVCNNLETLIYMVNLGCIDINPWNSRIHHIDKPDYVIFDLDPEDIGFEKVVDAANEIHEVLEHLNIESYPKTSGATGIHIYVPMGAKYSYDQVKSFAEVIVNIVQKKNPEYTSVLRSPSKRGGKVYLDFLQNRIGQTLAAPYSVRAKPGATVSTPLEWDEVNHKMTPQDFTIKNILNRLEKKGDLFKPVLGNGIDLKKVISSLDKLIG